MTTSNDGEFLGQLYPGAPCYNDCDPLAGAPVEVRVDAVSTGIDFALEAGGVISGTVTASHTGEPIASGRVRVFDDEGREASAQLDPSGRYSVAGLAPGLYFVKTGNNENFVDEVYDDVSCPFACDLTLGVPLTLQLGASVTGIDFALDRFGSISGTVVPTRIDLGG